MFWPFFFLFRYSLNWCTSPITPHMLSSLYKKCCVSGERGERVLSYCVKPSITQILGSLLVMERPLHRNSACEGNVLTFFYFMNQTLDTSITLRDALHRLGHLVIRKSFLRALRCLFLKLSFVLAKTDWIMSALPQWLLHQEHH